MSDTANANADVDERIKEMSSFRALDDPPELGGICGTIAVFVCFGLFAYDSGMFNSQGVLNWSIVSAQFMIIAVGACLLDDRRRIRLVCRLNDRLCRHDDRHLFGDAGLAGLAGHHHSFIMCSQSAR